MTEDPVIVRLYFIWSEVLKLYDELKTAKEGFMVGGGKTDKIGFWLFGGRPCFLTTNAVPDESRAKTSSSGNMRVNANDYDPIQKIEDSSYWEDPLFPIVGDNSPEFFDAAELLRVAENPSELGAEPKYLCFDLKAKSIKPWIMFTEKDEKIIFLG